MDRRLGVLDHGSKVSPGCFGVLIRRKDTPGSLVQSSLDVLPGRAADMASLAFVPDRAPAESQEGFGFIRPHEDHGLVELASGRTAHGNANHAEREKAGEGGVGPLRAGLALPTQRCGGSRGVSWRRPTPFVASSDGSPLVNLN